MLRLPRAIGVGWIALVSLVSGACSDSSSAAGDCSGDCGTGSGRHDGAKDDGETCEKNEDCASLYCENAVCRQASSTDGVRNGHETDVDCGGPTAPTCAESKVCLVDGDCHGACNYDHKCVDIPSCKVHLGGDTCGKGEVDAFDAQHESCCRTLPVRGYEDPAHPGKTVYLDKYEITAGRVRAFLADVSAKHGGKPNVAAWVAAHRPEIWDPSWETFLPRDSASGKVRVNRLLLGDRRPGPDHPPPPDTDRDQNTGADYQFNAQFFVYLHGNNCSTHAPSAYGFPTWFYPPDILVKQGEGTDIVFPPRADGRNDAGMLVPAREALDVKSMNCITNAMLAAFCAWDGGQLATDEILDYVTDSPKDLGNDPGCGSQIGSEYPPKTAAATSGGRCPDLRKINATFDAGGTLPEPTYWGNANNYQYPFVDSSVAHDKAWAVAAPGRGTSVTDGEPADMVRIEPGDEPWMDLAGNLNEVVFTMNGASFSGKFGLKYRGLGFQSARSELNTNPNWEGEGGIRRIERPEAKAAFAGGRCMRFR